MSNTLLHKSLSAKPETPDPTMIGSGKYAEEHLFAGGSGTKLLQWDEAQSDKVSWVDHIALAQGTITSDTPNLDSSVTWNAAGIVGPAWKLNVTDTVSNAAALLADLQIGGVSKWKVDKTGKVTQTGLILLPPGSVSAPSVAGSSDPSGGWYAPFVGDRGFVWGNNERLRLGQQSSGGYLTVAGGGTNVGALNMAATFGSLGTPDLQLWRDAAAALQLGADAAAPIAQTLKAHDGVGTDIAGASLTLAGGNGTGTGLGGALIFKTTPAGSTGSTQNPSTERMRISSAGLLTTAVGGSAALTATFVTIAHRNVTPVGNVGTGTDDLMAYSLDADALDGAQGLRIYAWGTTANNAAAKTVTLNVGSQVVMTQALTASIAGTWRIEARVFRTGASTQEIFAELLQLTTIIHKQTVTAGTQTDTAAIVIKCTGTATTNNDIVQRGLVVEIVN